MKTKNNFAPLWAVIIAWSILFLFSCKKEDTQPVQKTKQSLELDMSGTALSDSTQATAFYIITKNGVDTKTVLNMNAYSHYDIKTVLETGDVLHAEIITTLCPYNHTPSSYIFLWKDSGGHSIGTNYFNGKNKVTLDYEQK